MSKVRFKIQSRCSRYWFWVYVYDELAQLRAEASAFGRGMGDTDSFDDILGICQPYTRTEVATKQVHGNIGIVRLAKEHLATCIVAHEVVHATLWAYRVEHKRANFGQTVTEGEEDFAHLYGELFTNMTKRLYEKGFWQ